MKILTKFAIASLTLTLCAQSTWAQTKLDTAERTEVLKRIGRALEERYVFPELGTSCRTYLQNAAEAGVFEQDDDPIAFASHLTKELQRITKDGHMRVRHRAARLMRERRDDPAAARARRLRQMRERNYGIQSVTRLDGNIGYLDLRAFVGMEGAATRAAAAMCLLHGADAIIVDLRRNGGGSPDMVQFLCSYFFAEKTHLNSLYWREGNTTKEYWTLDDLPGPRMADVPLFVLTSSRTFSAAEEFTYNLKTRKRATAVGETTGGGANPGGMVPVGKRFGIFVPTGRAINPITKTNWEGTGIEPDIACEADDALATALRQARKEAVGYRSTKAAREQQQMEAVKVQLAAIDTMAKNKQWSEASVAVAKVLELATESGLWSEGAANELGYSYLTRGDVEIAIAAFTFNVKAHPSSSNCYDSLGEAYMAAGDTKRGIANYKRAVELDSSNDAARRIIEKHK